MLYPFWLKRGSSFQVSAYKLSFAMYLWLCMNTVHSYQYSRALNISCEWKHGKKIDKSKEKWLGHVTSFINLLIQYAEIYWFDIDGLTDWLTDWLTGWLIDSFLRSLIPSFIHSFVHSFIHSFLPSFLPSFIHSFIHPFLTCWFIGSTHSGQTHWMLVSLVQGLVRWLAWFIHWLNERPQHRSWMDQDSGGLVFWQGVRQLVDDILPQHQIPKLVAGSMWQKTLNSTSNGAFYNRIARGTYLFFASTNIIFLRLLVYVLEAPFK